MCLFEACDEAYNKTEEQDACNLGCRSQLPQAKKLREHVSLIWVDILLSLH